MQFFREATDVQFDETGNRKRKHRYGDEDEIEMEQQERKRRAMLNREVKSFAEKIAETASTSVSEVNASITWTPRSCLLGISLVKLSNWIFHSENFPLRVYHSVQVSVCNRRQIASFI